MDTELVDFLQESFASIWAVEILLALHRDPARTWAPEQIIEELRSSQVVVRQSLEGLFAAGLIVEEEDGSVRYGPASPAQRELVDRLAEAYRIMPGAVRRVIVQSPADKLRTFSDAFRIIKE
jgi:hypothetical protein